MSSAEYQKGYKAGRRANLANVKLQVATQIMQGMITNGQRWNLDSKPATCGHEWAIVCGDLADHLMRECGVKHD